MREIPLIVGIEFNELSEEQCEEFSEDEKQFTNSFGLGVLCMVAGPGWKIEDTKDFRYRLLVTNKVIEMTSRKGRGIIDQEGLYGMLTPDLVDRMKAADWQTNGGTISKRAWKADIKKRLFENVIEDVFP